MENSQHFWRKIGGWGCGSQNGLKCEGSLVQFQNQFTSLLTLLLHLTCIISKYKNLFLLSWSFLIAVPTTFCSYSHPNISNLFTPNFIFQLSSLSLSYSGSFQVISWQFYSQSHFITPIARIICIPSLSRTSSDACGHDRTHLIHISHPICCSVIWLG